MKPISFPWQQGAGQEGGIHEDHNMPLTKNQTLAVAQPVAIAFSAKDSGMDAAVELSPTLRAQNSVDGNQNSSWSVAVVQPVPYDLRQVTAPVNRQNRAPGDPCHALAQDNAAHAAIVAPQPVATDLYNGEITGDVAATLGTPGSSVNASGPTVMQPLAICFQDDATPKVKEETAFCLRREAGGEGSCVMTPAMQVRRLTPVECERLQGFPDGWTAIPWRGKPADQCPDGPRYKALGNSMAVPVMRWIGQQLDKVK